MMINYYYATHVGHSVWCLLRMALFAALVTLPFSELDGMEYGTPLKTEVSKGKQPNSCQITSVSTTIGTCDVPASGPFTADLIFTINDVPTGGDDLEVSALGSVVAIENVSSGAMQTVTFSNVDLTATNGVVTITAQFVNTPSCSFTTKLGDNQPPSILCPPSGTLDLDVNCEVTIPDLSTLVIVSDNCTLPQDITIDQDVTPGALAAVDDEIISIKVTATDEVGRSSECTANYTVEDNTSPGLVCNNFNLILDPSGNATLSVSSLATGADNCGGGVPNIITFLDANDSSFDCGDVGPNSVVVVAEDEAGNQDQCTVTVNVIDNTPPIASCTNLTVQLDSNGNGSATAAAVDEGGSGDVCGIFSLSLAQTSFDCSDVGTNLVALSVEDVNGNISSCNSVIEVEDNIAPVALCQDITVQLQADGTATLMPMEVDNGSNDACGIDDLSLSKSTFDCSDVGAQQVTLTVTDVNDNFSSCDADVTVEDLVAPVANCKSTTVQLDSDGQATITTSDIDDNSTDACGIASLSLDDTSLECTDFGNDPTVTLTVVDNNGNSSSCTATVFVEDNINPVVQCLNPTVELRAEDAQYDLLQSDIFDAANSGDNCSIVSVTFPPATYGCQDAGNSFPVELTVTDAAGNTDACTATVTVLEGDELPNNWSQADVGIVGPTGNMYNFAPCSANLPENGEFAITGSSSNGISGADNIAYAYQNVCGNGMIVAKIEQVDANGYGGLTVRENAADPNSKQYSIFTNLSNVLYLQRRTVTGAPKQSELLYRPFPVWLKIERIGNTIIASYSTNGSFFQTVSIFNLPMQECVSFGMASFSSVNAPSTAIFSNVQLMGSGGSTLLIGAPSNANVSVVSQQAQPVYELFPNPASEIVNLSIGQHQSPVRIVLRNQIGQVLEQRVVEPGHSNLEWPVIDLESGFYIFEFQTPEGDHTSLRFIKQ